MTVLHQQTHKTLSIVELTDREFLCSTCLGVMAEKYMSNATYNFY